jgi:cystathionine beta-lyase
LASGEVRLLILCSPHNPVGRVWRADELNRLGNLCLRYEVPVIADEIHMDFTYGEHRHHMFASLNPAFAEISITCTAPSKTFNLAGLQLSNLIIPNEPLRQAVEQNLLRTGYDEPNTFGLTACVAAYRAGDAWLQAVRTYIYENYLYLKNCFVRRNLPVRVCELQGTYLAWVDFRPTGLAPEVITRKIVQEAGLWLDAGEMFGRSGAGFQRINLACPRRILEQAVERLCPLFGS